MSGEKSAYRGVVESLLPAIRPYVASRSLPGVDVDEVVQRVFIEAYQNLGQYSEGTNLRAWLFAIARYQILAETTRLRRQADYHSRFVPVAVARQVEQRLTDEEFEDDRLPYLRDCLDQMTESSRDLLRRRYEDDLSMQEIGRVLKRTAGAVRKELCLVRKKLHECIERKMSLQGVPKG